jgi:hypothetical protein
MKTRFLISSVILASTIALRAVPLTESTFTEVVKDVNVVAQTTKAATPAKMQAVVKAPDLVRTGPESRAELTAPDQTLTRVGANTVFSFDTTGRQIDLQQGSLLFHSPSGKGGGTIKSGGAAAAVLGTTIIVAATPGGGFKVIVLEGVGKVTLPGGKTAILKAGQMIYILPGQGAGKVIDINLDKLVGGSQLVNGFSQPLPSIDLVRAAIAKQLKLIAKGKAIDTGLPPNINNFPPGNGLNAIDNNVVHGSSGQPGKIGLSGQSTSSGGLEIINSFPTSGGAMFDVFGNPVQTTLSSGTLGGSVSSGLTIQTIH